MTRCNVCFTVWTGEAKRPARMHRRSNAGGILSAGCQARATLGTLVFSFDDDVAGIVYGVGTFGDTDKAVTAGLGFFHSGDEVANEPAFMPGGETRFSRRIKLMTENHLLPEAVGVVLSGGIRVMGDRFATEIGIVGALTDGDADCCIPLVNFTYAFGRK